MEEKRRERESGKKCGSFNLKRNKWRRTTEREKKKMEMGHERGIFALAGLTASGALLRGTHAGLWRGATGEESASIVDREGGDGDDVFAAVLGEPVNGLVLLRRAPDLEADGGWRGGRFAETVFFSRGGPFCFPRAYIEEREGEGEEGITRSRLGRPF